MRLPFQVAFFLIKKMNLKELFKDSFKNRKEEYSDVITSKEINLLLENKILKAYLPKTLGGLEYNIFEMLNLIEDAGYLNGSLGWLVQIGNGGNYFASNFKNQKVLEQFKEPHFVIAGSGTSTCKAERKGEGVYIEYGTWKYCSGSNYASHFTITFDLEGKTVSALLPKNDVNIVYDWNTIGMKNTSTNSIEVHNIYIPNENLFKVDKQINFLETPIFNLPFIVYAQGFFIHVLYGMVKRMINESGINKFDEKLKLFKEENKEIINTCLEENELSEKQQIIFQDKYQNQAKEIKNIANCIYEKNGMKSIYINNIISVFYLDIITICQHKLLQKSE